VTLADAVETVTFDSYSTLVDVDAAETALAEYAGDQTEHVSRRWRTRSLRYTMIASAVGAYRPFYDLLRDALTYALAAEGVETTAAEREEILAVYHELDVFDDVVGGLERLAEAGYPLYVVSNGNHEMLSSMVEHAGIGGVLDGRVSADDVERFKPHPAIYREAAARSGTPIDGVCHVSAGHFDVHGALAAGMAAAWLDRDGSPPDPFCPDPDLVAGSIHDLADALEA
jgi:2-haloacid dehalogenase